MSARNESTVRLIAASSDSFWPTIFSDSSTAKRADLAAEFANDLAALRGQLFLAPSDDPSGFLLGLRPQVLDDPLRLGPGVLPDLGRLGPGLGQLRLVLLEQLGRLGLRRLGPRDATFDGVPASSNVFSNCGHDELAHQEEQDREDDQDQDELGTLNPSGFGSSVAAR